MIQDKSSVLQFLDSVFTENPLSEFDQYVPSALSDARRVMNAESLRVEETSLRRLPKQPAWLRGGSLRSPWELELVGHIFRGYPLLVVQGASGCGKTTALRFVLSSEHSDPTATTRCPHLLLRIDLNPLEVGLQRDTQESSERSVQLESFMKLLCSAVDSWLAEHFTFEVLFEVFKSAFLDKQSGGQPIDQRTTVVATVRAAADPMCNEQKKRDSLDWEMLQRFMDTPLLPHNRLIARYAMLRSLGKRQVVSCGGRVVLVIDNVDPLPEYLVTDLIGTFEVLRGAYPHANRLEPLSIVMFARHTTSNRHIGALDGVNAKRVQFQAPDPADVIFFRLTAMLRNPDEFLGWDSLEKADQKELVARGLYMWQRLANPASYFSRVLSGLAGTNVRTGSKLAKNWIVASRHRAFAPKLLAGGLRGSHRMIGAAALVRLATSVSRVISCIPEDDDFTQVAQTIGTSFFSSLLGILLGNRLVERKRKMARPDSEIRSLLDNDVRAWLLTFLSGEANRPLREAAGAPLSRTVNEGLMQLRRSGVEWSSDQIVLTLTETERELQPKVAEVVAAADTELAIALCGWLIDMVGRGATATEGTLYDRRVSDLFESLVPTDAFTSVPETRWLSTSIMVSPEAAFGREGGSALNVFSSDGHLLSPVALHVLCQLQDSHHGMLATVLMTRLQQLDFRQDEILTALKDMVRIDHRLIYSSVRDESEELQFWFDGTHDVFISSAGTSYLSHVTSCPAYLQWALGGPRGIRHEMGLTDAEVRDAGNSALGRLALVLRGLRVVHKDERRRSEAAYSTRLVDIKKIYSPLCWVFFGSLSRFMVDLASQEGKVLVSDLAADFLAFGCELLTVQREMYCGRPPEWAEELEHNVRFYQNTFQRPLPEVFQAAGEY